MHNMGLAMTQTGNSYQKMLVIASQSALVKGKGIDLLQLGYLFNDFQIGMTLGEATLSVSHSRFQSV